MAVENFDEYLKMPKSELKVPVFSKAGFNMIKYFILSKFSKKTKEEKVFREMCKNKATKDYIEKCSFNQ